MDAIEAEEFQDCAFYGIKLAEEAEDWVVRDNMLRSGHGWRLPRMFRTQRMMFI